MDKALLTCLCIIMLISAGIIGLTSFSSQAQAPAGGIITENADYIANKTTEYSADLINIAENVTPRIVVEYGDSVSTLDLNKSDDLNQVASVVTPRIIVEYADSIFEHVLESVTVPDITPRIIVEYADSIFSTDLEHPLFGAEVSARIDSYSISPRNVTVGGDVTIGFSFTNTGNFSWKFGAGATFRKPDGTQIDFLEAVTVNPGESGSAQWTYTIDMTGRWNILFGVWKEYTHPLESLLDQTGWVPEYVTATVTAVDNQPPVADAGEDQTVNEDTLVTFDGSASSDNVGITSYTWTLTDVTLQTLTDVNPTYIFSTPGTYTVTLNVTDEAGNFATDTVVITVLDATNPVADAGSDQTVTEDTSVSFDASGSTDNAAIVSYEWDFGDGTNGTGVIAYHTYTEPGTYTVTLTVWDVAGNSDTDSIIITVLSAEEPPPPAEAFPLWIVGAAVAIIAIATAAIAVFWRRRKQPPRKISGSNRSMRLKVVN